MIEITCISDLHGYEPKLTGGDLLIIAGDFTAADTEKQHVEFIDWVSKQNYTKIILVPGNHDGHYEKYGPFDCKKEDKIQILMDSGYEFKGFKIWGSPWTPIFFNWHFMLKRGREIKKKWDLIPEDTDILVTHGPAYGICDQTQSYRVVQRVGCQDLEEAVARVQPQLHVFGHIHQGYGKHILAHENGKETICINAALMDECYNPLNKPINIKL